MINTPEYESKIAEATKIALGLQHRVLQIFQLGDSEPEHLENLLRLADLPRNARVLDLGCGVGEVAKGFQALRPDLRFVLLNNNEYQISQCPDDMDVIYGDMHKTYFVDSAFTAVMLNYALGYAEPEKLFLEISRLLPRKGTLFIADITGNKETAKDCLDYKVWQPDEIVEMCPLKLDWYRFFASGYSSPIDGLAPPEIVERVRKDMRPVYYRFHKP